MKKFKFLILALLGITIIPTTTNAFELSKVSYVKKTLASSNFWFFEKACLKPILGSFPSWILRDGGYIERVLFNQTTCRDGYSLGNYYSDESHGGYNSDKVYMRMYRYSMITTSENGEGLDFWRTSMMNNTQTLHKFSIPSRTAYQYTTVGGQKFTLTQVYFYHNQFLLYDPTTRFSVSFLGKMKIENGMLLVNPDAITDNLWFINFQKKKAWSMTTTKTGALKWLLGVDISKDRLEALQFDKSYIMEEGGNRFLPAQFSPNSQGETVGWLYNEDTEFISPDFNTKKQETNSAEAYNQCSSYWSDVKNLAYYSQKCGDDPADEQTQNRVKVDSWNAEGSLPEFAEGANKNKCGRFANAKKKYKEKYKDQREKFYADFSVYARTPESVNVEVQCKGVELEHNSPNKSAIEALKDFFKSPLDYFQSFRDRFNDYDGQPIGVYSGKNYYNYDFQADSSKLRLLYEECFSTSWEYSILTKEDRMNSCRKYEELKLELGKVYSSMTGVIFSSGFQEYVNSLEKNNLNDDIGLGKRFISVISDPFYSGFNAVNFVAPVCSGTNYDFFNIFFYLFYFGAVLYIFKLFA